MLCIAISIRNLNKLCGIEINVFESNQDSVEPKEIISWKCAGAGIGIRDRLQQTNDFCKYKKLQVSYRIRPIRLTF